MRRPTIPQAAVMAHLHKEVMAALPSKATEAPLSKVTVHLNRAMARLLQDSKAMVVLPNKVATAVHLSKDTVRLHKASKATVPRLKEASIPVRDSTASSRGRHREDHLLRADIPASSNTDRDHLRLAGTSSLNTVE